MNIGDERLPDRFWRKVKPNELTGCWEWQDYLHNGYGAFYVSRRRRIRSHRLVMGTIEPIPDGLVIDHICRVRRCVNPKHLRVVTPATNSLENNLSPVALNARKKHCIRGHAFADGHWIDSRGYRVCEQCRRPKHLLGTKMRTYDLNRTNCKYGHELTPENLMIVKGTGQRKCRICIRRMNREAYKRKISRTQNGSHAIQCA